MKISIIIKVFRNASYIWYRGLQTATAIYTLTNLKKAYHNNIKNSPTCITRMFATKLSYGSYRPLMETNNILQSPVWPYLYMYQLTSWPRDCLHNNYMNVNMHVTCCDVTCCWHASAAFHMSSTCMSRRPHACHMSSTYMSLFSTEIVVAVIKFMGFHNIMTVSLLQQACLITACICAHNMHGFES